MDSLAHLALMTKAQLVFAAPDTFLSFPALSPLSYSPDELSFASGNALSVQQLRMFAEFSRVTNSLPLGTIFQPPPDTYLWDKYHEVLTTSILASGTPSSDQQAAIAAAQAYLHVTTPDGLQTDSPAVITYKQYRDAWFKALQEYKEKQLTASASTDPKQQAQWRDTDEPALRAKTAEAEANWESKGNKAAVEQAQKAATEAASQSPQLIWREWSSKFIPEIDLQTDPEQNTFALTGFLPNNAIEQKDWPSFTLTAFEIGHLVGQAPRELAGIFGELPSTSEIDSISFEYRSVGLERPWLEPKVFSARFWKSADPSAQLSDGSDPPSGEWPAYITAVVFARNIVVNVRAANGPPAPVQLRTLPSITQRLEFVPQAGAGDSAPALKPAVSETPVALHLPPAATAARPAARMHAPASAAAAATPMDITTVFELAGPWAAGGGPGPKISRSGSTLTVDMSAYGRPPAHGSIIDAQTVTVTFSDDATFTGQLLPPVTIAWSNGTSWTRVPAPTLPPEPKPEVVTDVSILSFICKRLPKCPNPDPALKW